MSIEVCCSACDFCREMEEIEDILILQNQHQEAHGDHHVLEFEREE